MRNVESIEGVTFTHRVRFYAGECGPSHLDVVILEDKTDREYGFLYGTMHVITNEADMFGHYDRWISFGLYNAVAIDALTVPASPARLTVISGPSTVGVQMIPTTLVAATLRLSRGTPGGYGYGDYARKGWRMRTWITPASRERFRLAQCADL